ncbi:MAG: monofunctional biosynthetic peptidoglycan transglycosylase [Oricola sp.]
MASSRKTGDSAGRKGGSGRTRSKAPSVAERLRRALARWLRRAVILVLVLAALPFAATLLYRAEFIHPVSTLMLRDLATLKGYERDWVDLDAVAPVLIRSVVMSEDGKFCRHNGVDWGALNEVIGDALEGEQTRGASTITMQTAKNLFLWPGRSFIRKGLEIPMAMWIDFVLPKRRIMEIYLNIAEWGDGIYGIEAASWIRFGRPASELTGRQAALLTVTLPNPHRRDPANPSAGIQRLAGIIEQRAVRYGSHADCLF